MAVDDRRRIGTTGAVRPLVGRTIPSEPRANVGRRLLVALAICALVAALVIGLRMASTDERDVTANGLAAIFEDSSSVRAREFQAVAGPVRLSGEVRETRVFEGVPVIDFRTANYVRIRAELPKSETAAVGRLQAGDVVEVACGAFSAVGGVTLRECTLER